MDEPLVSLIVPVYNVAEYIENCVLSVLAQTVGRWELLLVDDGSTDGSGDLCDRLAAGHANVTVIHQENAGPSAARNAALPVCRGEWVLFLDADDMLTPDALAVMLRAGEEKQADLVCCEFTEFASGSDAVLHRSCSGAPETFTGREALRWMLSSAKIYVLLCNKLYRRSLIGEERLPEELHTGEDLLFLTRLLFKAGTVTTVPEVLYCYRIHNDSLTRSASCAHVMDAVRSAEEVQRFVEEYCPENAPLGEFRVYYAYLTVLDCLILGGRGKDDGEYQRVWGCIVANRSLIRNCAGLSRARRASARLITYWPGLYGAIVRRRARRAAHAQKRAAGKANR